MKHIIAIRTNPTVIDIGPFSEEGARDMKAQRLWLVMQAPCDEQEGLINFLDRIADQLEERYGYDTDYSPTEDNDA